MSRRRPCKRGSVKAIGRCKATGKKRFRTELDADTVIANAQFAARILHHHQRRESRSYQCRHCKAWHVTSQPLNEPSWKKSA